MEFITTQSAPPTLPPVQKQYQSQAVIYLTNEGSRRGSNAGDDKPGLVRAISRGSIGRRSSTGGNSDSGGIGGGLRRVLSRGEKPDSQGRRGSDANNVLKHADSDATGAAPPLQRTKSAELKTGKWISPVMAGVVGNSLVIALAVDSVLVPYGSQDAGRNAKQAATSATSATSGPSTTGATDSHSAGGGIGEKIKNIFRRTSSSHQGTAAHADETSGATTTTRAESSVSENTAVDAPLNSLEGHHQLAEQKHDQSYPAYINGAPVKYIVVPLSALDYKTITLKHDKGVWTLRVPVTGHFGRFVEPALQEIGKSPEETWGRSGEIDFLFDSKNWIGAKE
ncbi:hypothetical protein QFC22_001398 [Naganishia vaughanmartiniae]|uniref:Uncharacterized protein n=1 Tax=Naganishia vaughanmartiniae TaxID=1424756 RepID=A0ACC2XGQ8_9TREE|nr:hypothetical protein QFC22_001398 [Naganishia vaughanmartiniae]